MDIISRLKNASELDYYIDFRSGSGIDLSGNSRDVTFHSSNKFSREGLHPLINNSVSVGHDTRPAIGTIFGLVQLGVTGVHFIKWELAGVNTAVYISFNSSNQIDFYFHTGGANFTLTTTSTFKRGETIYYGCEYGSAGAKLYVNGSLEDTDPETNPPYEAWADTQLVTSVYAIHKAVGLISRNLTAIEHAELYVYLQNLKFPTRVTSKSKANTIVADSDNLIAGYNMRPVDNELVDVTSYKNADIYGAVHEPDRMIGNFLKFNGEGNYAIAGTVADWKMLHNGSSWTIEGWAKLTDANPDTFNTIIATSTASSGSTGITIAIDDRSGAGGRQRVIYLEVVGGGGAGGATSHIIASVNDGWPNDTNPHHLTVTFDGSASGVLNQFTCYVDKQEIDFNITYDQPDFSTGNSSYPLNIGRIGSNVFHFKGAIGPIRIFNEVKSADWVEAEYDRVQQSAVAFKSSWGVKESVAIEGGTIGAYLSNSPLQFGDTTGRFKVSSDTINGENVKVIECTTDGILGLKREHFSSNSTEASYGETEFWIYVASGNYPKVVLSANVLAPCNDGSMNGYACTFNQPGNEIGLYTITGGVSQEGAGQRFYAFGDPDADTWYKCNLPRNTTGLSFYLDDELITPANGDNPVTDQSHTTGEYIVFELEAGDKIAFADLSGKYSIIKRPLA